MVVLLTNFLVPSCKLDYKYNFLFFIFLVFIGEKDNFLEREHIFSFSFSFFNFHSHSFWIVLKLLEIAPYFSFIGSSRINPLGHSNPTPILVINIVVVYESGILSPTLHFNQKEKVKVFTSLKFLFVTHY